MLDVIINYLIAVRIRIIKTIVHIFSSAVKIFSLVVHRELRTEIHTVRFLLKTPFSPIAEII